MKPTAFAFSVLPLTALLLGIGAPALPAPPQATPDPAPEDRFGPPVWDPSSHSWFRQANGTIVRMGNDGALTVVVDDVQGTDIDVRALAGVAVSREPNGAIVLHRFSQGRTVLARGTGLSGPRLSPDGSRVLVTESRPTGGHVLVLTPGLPPTDLGPGHSPSWAPDGRVVLARLSHDGYRVSSSTLLRIDPTTGATVTLPGPTGVAAIRPTVSDDGSWLVFVDAHTGATHVSQMPATGHRGAP